MRFWLDKGIAGFRCDVINILYKTSLTMVLKGWPSRVVNTIFHRREPMRSSEPSGVKCSTTMTALPWEKQSL